MMDNQSARHSSLLLPIPAYILSAGRYLMTLSLQNNPVELREGGRLRFAASSRAYMLQQNVATLAATSDSKLLAGDGQILSICLAKRSV